MELGDIQLLAERHPAWRLLRAQHAPLVLSFLGAVFVEGNSGPVSQSRLAEQLEDHLHAVRAARPEETRWNGDAPDYLEDWAGADKGWLRRFYGEGDDEVHYDATPALERAYAWVLSLRPRPSIGTESRLHTLVELLRQMVQGAEGDAPTRLADLNRRREALDAEIAAVESGDFTVMDGSALRERYAFFVSAARDLLSDFREVEENFRALDRGTRERIATWSGAKGELLASLVADRTDIAGSDQGRSFQAFYDFLLSAERQSELAELLDRVQELEGVQVEPRFRRVHHDWFDAAERTQATVRSLSEQLRRFLDDQVWLENRRVLELVRSIEASALALRDHPPEAGVQLEDQQLPIVLPFERPLYEARQSSAVDSTVRLADEELDTTALFAQSYVDAARLASQIRSVVPPRSSALLRDVLELYPLQDGLAELVGYLALDDEDLHVELDEEKSLVLVVDGEQGPRTVRLPEATVVRT